MTTLSRWTFDLEGPLVGVGLDAERVERFREYRVPEGDPWELLFTEREIKHHRELADPALGFCASFCAKEAVVKALGVSIDYRDCELLLAPSREDQVVLLSNDFRDEHGIEGGMARFVHRPEQGECIVAVCLIRSAGKKSEA